MELNPIRVVFVTVGNSDLAAMACDILEREGRGRFAAQLAYDDLSGDDRWSQPAGAGDQPSQSAKPAIGKPAIGLSALRHDAASQPDVIIVLGPAKRVAACRRWPSRPVTGGWDVIAEAVGDRSQQRRAVEARVRDFIAHADPAPVCDTAFAERRRAQRNRTIHPLTQPQPHHGPALALSGPFAPAKAN